MTIFIRPHQNQLDERYVSHRVTYTGLTSKASYIVQLSRLQPKMTQVESFLHNVTNFDRTGSGRLMSVYFLLSALW